MVICNRCFKIKHHRQAGFSCGEYGCEGMLLQIDTYVDFTSPMKPKLTLHRHPKSLTIFTEKGFFEHFEMNACRVISEEYLQDMPQFLKVYPIDPTITPIPIKIFKEFILEAMGKITEYNRKHNVNYPADKETIKKLIFLNSRKEKLIQLRDSEITQ